MTPHSLSRVTAPRSRTFPPMALALGAAFLFLGAGSARSQGRLTGSFDSNTIIYTADPVTHTEVSPDNRYGSMNYLKLDYGAKDWGAGLKMEYHPSVIKGFDASLKGGSLTGIYARWGKTLGGVKVEVTAGDFYEQFGSGIALRSYEDRELGIDNSIGGARIALSALEGAVRVKVLGGFPRYGIGSMLNSRTTTLLGGADLSVRLNDILGIDKENATLLPLFTLEGSFLNRHEGTVPSDIEALSRAGGFSVPSDVLSTSARLLVEKGPVSLSGEWVHKGRDLTSTHTLGSLLDWGLGDGDALLLGASASIGNVSATLTGRQLRNMEDRMFRTAGALTEGNTLNYLPSLCQMQTYLLAGLNPYTTLARGERGVQGDLYWRLPRRSALGGKYGMNIHIGGSYIWALPVALSNHDSPAMAYRDLNFDIEKKWSPELRTVLFISIQENSPSHGQTSRTDAQNVFVLDGTYKFRGSPFSIHAELQYLYSQELTRDWMAGVLEVNFAPHWGLALSDMYNHGSTKVHYYSAMCSYSQGALRAELSFGRNREGMVCSGGVCRFRPAYTGGQLTIKYSF